MKKRPVPIFVMKTPVPYYAADHQHFGKYIIFESPATLKMEYLLAFYAELLEAMVRHGTGPIILRFDNDTSYAWKDKRQTTKVHVDLVWCTRMRGKEHWVMSTLIKTPANLAERLRQAVIAQSKITCSVDVRSVP